MATGATLLLLIVFLYIFQAQIRNSFYIISSPLSNIFFNTGSDTHGFFDSFSSIKNLQEENNNLKTKNQELLYQVSLLQDSLRQNGAEKQLLNLQLENNFTLVLAQTIGLDTLNDSMIINKGSKDGVKEHMAIISNQKVLLGKIGKVYENFSDVVLLSNKNSVVDVEIYPVKSASQGEAMPTEGGQFNEVKNSNQNQLPIYGVIKGEGNLAMYLDLVHTDEPLKERDVLVTSALEGIFPKNLPVGEIISIVKNDAKPFQTATVQSFFDTKNIENVFIITNYNHQR